MDNRVPYAQKQEVYHHQQLVELSAGVECGPVQTHQDLSVQELPAGNSADGYPLRPVAPPDAIPIQLVLHRHQTGLPQHPPGRGQLAQVHSLSDPYQHPINDEQPHHGPRLQDQL